MALKNYFHRGIKLTVCCGLLVLSFAITAWLLPNLPLRAGATPGVEYMPDFEVPPGDEYFFIFGIKAELSQSILYHDLGDSISNAKAADILFIGDSRLQLGLRGEFLIPKARELGLSLFSLGMGHSEGVRFALDLIKKHDLNPKMVVAVGGAHMFNGGYSGMASQAIRMSRWDAIKNRIEAVVWWNVQFRLHRLVPKISFFTGRFQPGYVLYRSAQSGWWNPALEWNGTYPIRPNNDEKNYERFLPMAKELKSELDARGSLLVLGLVPYRLFSSGHLPYFSKELGVSSVFPPIDRLTTADSSHLNRESAKIYSNMFWEELITLPEVREKLSLP